MLETEVAGREGARGRLVTRKERQKRSHQPQEMSQQGKSQQVKRQQ